METKKIAITCGVCAVLIGGAIVTYFKLSEIAAVEQYNDEHRKMTEKDANYARLFDNISKAKQFQTVVESAEFKKAFAQACPENSVQSKFMKLEGLEASTVTKMVEITTKTDYYGKVTPDTIYHYKGNMHTSDGLVQENFDISNRGMIAELSIASCYQTTDFDIPADAVFQPCGWKVANEDEGDYYQDLEDCNWSIGTLTVHVSRTMGAYVVIGEQVGLENLSDNATLIVNDGANLIHSIAGVVRDNTIFQITDFETMTDVFYDPTREIVLSITSVNPKGISKTYSQKLVSPNIWAAYTLSAGVTPKEVFDGMCEGKDFRNIVREASLKRINFDLPELKK